MDTSISLYNFFRVFESLSWHRESDILTLKVPPDHLNGFRSWLPQHKVGSVTLYVLGPKTRLVLPSDGYYLVTGHPVMISGVVVKSGGMYPVSRGTVVETGASLDSPPLGREHLGAMISILSDTDPHPLTSPPVRTILNTSLTFASDYDLVHGTFNVVPALESMQHLSTMLSSTYVPSPTILKTSQCVPITIRDS